MKPKCTICERETKHAYQPVYGWAEVSICRECESEICQNMSANLDLAIRLAILEKQVARLQKRRGRCARRSRSNA